jgi:hypothetical protein
MLRKFCKSLHPSSILGQASNIFSMLQCLRRGFPA